MARSAGPGAASGRGAVRLRRGRTMLEGTAAPGNRPTPPAAGAWRPTEDAMRPAPLALGAAAAIAAVLAGTWVATRQAGDALAACRGGQVAGGTLGGPFTLVDGTGRAVTDAEVLAAIAWAFTHLKLVIEPGGAVCLAALLSGRFEARGRVVGAVLSGGNVDPAVFTRALAA